MIKMEIININMSKDFLKSMLNSLEGTYDTRIIYPYVKHKGYTKEIILGR